MATTRKIILFEANEVPYRVIDHYAENHPGSHLANLMSSAKQFHTICEDQVELDPWISWPTLHRGVIDEQHQIFHLGQSLDDANRNYPPLWELLARRGIKVGVMGSLHSSVAPADLDDYAFYVPDFFAHETFAHPPALEAFQKFNLALTRKSALNVDRGIPIKESLDFLLRYVTHEMTLATVRAAVSELTMEALKPHLRCRRRSIQPLITLDLFMHLMKSRKPAFATLYTNHVAAAMHRYWAAAFPNDVDENSMPEAWRRKFSGEIDYTMDILDAMIGRLKGFADGNDSYILLVASSMGQAAVKSRISRTFVTIADLQVFLTRLGLREGDWSQRFSMVPCISVMVDPVKAELFERRLQQLRVGDKAMIRDRREIAPMSYDRKDGSFQLFVYFESYNGAPMARLGEEELHFDDLGFGFGERQDDVANSARHVPNGVLLVYDPRTKAIDHHRSEISTLDIAPAILHLFDVEQQTYMNQPDPRILDSGVMGTSVSVTVTGGGVERPVTRQPKTETPLEPIAAAAQQP